MTVLVESNDQVYTYNEINFIDKSKDCWILHKDIEEGSGTDKIHIAYSEADIYVDGVRIERRK